jgi:hypothetical protein
LIKKLGFAFLSVIVLVLAAFTAWGSTPSGPMPQALAALQSDDRVQVTSGEWVVFQPVGSQPTTGFIFYPGGHVDYRAYAPYLRDLAEQGTLAVLVPMPLSLAVLSPERAEDVIGSFPQVTTWVIGGHSLGGAMAANFVANHPDQVQGLVFLAAYPADSDSLAGQNIQVLSVSGSEDGLATREKIAASKTLLPSGTQFIEIQGGNHAQFGWYGLQNGDGVAQISREAQQEQALKATEDFLFGISHAASITR